MTIIYFALILGITVFIHELGHFIWAKKAGVHVYEFSIGMGPKIFSFHRKNDETDYCIRLFPVGGFVSMAGETEEETGVPKNKQLANKAWGWRFITISAGIIHNFLLAIFLFFVIGLFNGKVSRESFVAELQEGYPASSSTIQVGDEITGINGKSLYSSDLLMLELQVNQGKEIDLNVKHQNGTRENIHLAPMKEEVDGQEVYRYGFTLQNKVTKGLFPAIQFAFEKTISLTLQMIKIIGYLFTGVLSLNALSGPVGIFNIVGETAKAGLLNLVYLTGYLSLNVGFMNFLPIPAMDGGRLFFLLIEKIKGSPVNQKVENAIHTVGFGLLMILMLYITFNDIVKFF